jgi:hypothetical protein
LRRDQRSFRIGVAGLLACRHAGPGRAAAHAMWQRRRNFQRPIEGRLIDFTRTHRCMRRNNRPHARRGTPHQCRSPPRGTSASSECRRTQREQPQQGRESRAKNTGQGQCFEHPQAASGSSIRKVVPRPISDVNSIEPLCSCTMRNVLASPMPLPPGRVVKNS